MSIPQPVFFGPTRPPSRSSSPVPTGDRRQQSIREAHGPGRIFDPNWSTAHGSTDDNERRGLEQTALHQRAMAHVTEFGLSVSKLSEVVLLARVS